MMRRALVLGITGQVGSYMAELLLAKDYRVFGLVRRSSTPNTSRVAHLADRIELHPGDLTDLPSLHKILLATRPHEVYNFAAQSFVGSSFTMPLHTADVTGLGALKLYEACRLTFPIPETPKIYQASTSELFGNAKECPQSEDTPISPVSPYGCAKAFAHFSAQTYRQAYGMFIACGIAFNHESERRGEEFVTRKITKAIARIKAGTQHILRLGNVTAKRDWLHAEDVAQAAWLMLQQKEPHDYVIASGEVHSVQDFLDQAFNIAGINPSEYVKIDPSLYRPQDVQTLQGDARRIRRELGWAPTIPFGALVSRMVLHDLAEVESCHPVQVAPGPATP